MQNYVFSFKKHFNFVDVILAIQNNATHSGLLLVVYLFTTKMSTHRV